MRNEPQSITLPIEIPDIETAACFALELSSIFDRAFTFVLLDEDCLVIDGTIFTADEHNLHTAIEWAKCVVMTGSNAIEAVLFSIPEDDATQIRSDEIELFNETKTFFKGYGVQLVEWIKCDGNNFRFMSLTPDSPDR